MKHLIDLVHRQDYIDNKSAHCLSGLLDEICKMLIGYMNMIKTELE